MSTRSTLAYGEGFHLFHDLVDTDFFVHLSLDNVEFTVSPGNVTVKIPVAIWEFLRTIPTITLEYADMTDEDILWRVKSEVAVRIHMAEEEGSQQKSWILSRSSLVFGDIKDPEEEQIKSGLAYFHHMRGMQQGIASKLREFKKINSG